MEGIRGGYKEEKGQKQVKSNGETAQMINNTIHLAVNTIRNLQTCVYISNTPGIQGPASATPPIYDTARFPAAPAHRARDRHLIRNIRAIYIVTIYMHVLYLH